MIAIGDLETFLGISAGTDLALVLDIEAAAVEFVENFTHRFFGSTASDEGSDYSEVVEGQGHDELWLSEAPATLPPSVLQQPWPGATQVTITASDSDGYVQRGPRLVRKGGFVWRLGYEYVVTYDRGYVQTAAASADVTPEDVAAPDDIRHAVKKIVRIEYREIKSKAAVGGGLKSETMGNYSYTLGDLDEGRVFGADPILRQTLEHYRRRYV